MPILKKDFGDETKISAILSDDSLDRDDEMMHKELIKSWAETKSLPALMDHNNSMDSYHADWENIRYVENGSNGALMADPKPFPTARGKELSIQLEHGKNIGVSISAIPLAHEFIEKEYDGEKKKIKVYTKAKILEASFIPIQSNEHARAMRIAKGFNIHTDSVTKPASLERCVDALMSDPKFKPKRGKSKKESAYAVCTAAQKKGFTSVKEFVLDDLENKELFYKYFEKEEEDFKMEEFEKLKAEAEELKKKLSELEVFKKEMEEKAEAEKIEAEKEAEKAEKEAEEKKLKEIDALRKSNEELKKKLESQTIKKEALDDPEGDDEDMSKSYDLKADLRKFYGVKKE